MKTIGPSEEISRSMREPERRLAGTGFADDAEGLALAQFDA